MIVKVETIYINYQGCLKMSREVYIPEDGTAYVHFKRKNKDNLKK